MSESTTPRTGDPTADRATEPAGQVDDARTTTPGTAASVPVPPTEPDPAAVPGSPAEPGSPAGPDPASAPAPPTPPEDVSRIWVDEPPLPRRTRRPVDALRLVSVVAALIGLIALAVIAERTLTGLTRDLAALSAQLPSGALPVLSFATSLVGLALPPVLVIMLMLRGRLRTTVEVLSAGILASLAAALVTQLLLEPAADPVENVFVPAQTAVPAYPALLIAILTVVSRLRLRRIRQAALFAIIGSLVVGLLERYATFGGTLIAVGIGITVGLLVRLVSGQPSVAPDGRTLAVVLREHGYPISALRIEHFGEHRRYVAQVPDGRLDIAVIDRDSEGSGLIGRVIDSVRTRDEVLPRSTRNLRDAIDRTMLLSLATRNAGARTPRLHSAIRVSADAAAIVYDHVPGRTLASMPADEVTDDILEDLWRQVAHLRRQEIVHRRLIDTSILVGEDHQVWLLDPAGGEVTATELALRTDLAQALVTSALVVGADRTVATAVQVLGPTTVSQAVAVLQRAALSRSTRRALGENRSLLTELRTGIIRATGSDRAETVQLRRVRPLSLVTGIGALAAFYLVGSQLSDVSLSDLASQTDFRWLIVALAAMLLNYVGASYALLGFVPEKVPFLRTLAAQVALSFLRLVAPSAVGNVAVNIRLLTKAGVDGPLAAASVAANQVGNVAITVPLLGIFAVVSGSTAAANVSPSPTTIAIVLAALAAIGMLALIPRLRRLLVEGWRAFAERGLPRLFDVLSTPRKLAVAISGITVQLLSLVLCFYACVRAVGTTVDFTALAVVQLVGNTIGMAVPTPGGLGAVEAALTAGIGTIGVSAVYALPAVLLFRLVSFWLPIVPGWIVWTQLQRRQLV